MDNVRRAIVAYARQVRFANLKALASVGHEEAADDWLGHLWNLENIADVSAGLLQNPAYAFKSGIQ